MIHYAITLVLLFTTTSNYSAQCAITNQPTKSRLGDNLISYTKAKYLAYKYSVPFFFTLFKHSEQFVLHTQEIYCSPSLQKQSQVKRIEHEKNLKKDSNTLYQAHFHTKMKEWKTNYQPKLTDKLFLQELQTCIAPTKPIQLVNPPKNHLSVAVHVRRGGGYDPPLLATSYARKKVLWADKRWPLKFPPDQFYIDQITRLAQISKNKKLYVYIFTDYKDPEYIMKKYKQIISQKNIVWACRIGINNYKNSMLQDFFSMAQFDCLIRSESSFSTIVQLIGNFETVIYPTKCHWEKNNLIIDDVEIISDYDYKR